jgi:hypothetical protein
MAMQPMLRFRDVADWRTWAPGGRPPKHWSSPAIRFWQDVLKRPLPHTTKDPHVTLKWGPLTRDLIKERLKYTAVVLEYEATLLREMSTIDGEMAQFSNYLKEHELLWFTVGQEEFRAALAKAEEPSGVGIFLKYYFPTIRFRCNPDLLTKLVNEVFSDD